MFAAANFGVLLGSLVFSMVADKIGRRPVLVVGDVVLLGDDDRHGLRAERRSSCCGCGSSRGIGLGCIIPNATALVGEFSPKEARVTLMMCITVGFTVGAAIGGFVAAWLIPAFGWRSVFIFGGAVPLVIAVAMAYGPARVAAVPGRPQGRSTGAGEVAEQLDPRSPSTTRTRVRRQRRQQGRRAVRAPVPRRPRPR